MVEVEAQVVGFKAYYLETNVELPVDRDSTPNNSFAPELEKG